MRKVKSNIAASDFGDGRVKGSHPPPLPVSGLGILVSGALPSASAATWRAGRSTRETGRPSGRAWDVPEKKLPARLAAGAIARRMLIAGTTTQPVWSGAGQNYVFGSGDSRRNVH
jgi:hypothetical protein